MTMEVFEGRVTSSNIMSKSNRRVCFGFSEPLRMPLSVRVVSHIATAES